jgi:transaldolase
MPRCASRCPRRSRWPRRWPAGVPDFRAAYEPDGLTVEQFDGYAATVRTLRGFIASYQELVAIIREFMLPNPDTRK